MVDLDDGKFKKFLAVQEEKAIEENKIRQERYKKNRFPKPDKTKP